MYGLRASGTTTLPSACWKFSKMATIMRGTAHAVALRVCTNSVGTFLAFDLLPLLLVEESVVSAAFGLQCDTSLDTCSCPTKYSADYVGYK